MWGTLLYGGKFGLNDPGKDREGLGPGDILAVDEEGGCGEAAGDALEDFGIVEYGLVVAAAVNAVVEIGQVKLETLRVGLVGVVVQSEILEEEQLVEIPESVLLSGTVCGDSCRCGIGVDRGEWQVFDHVEDLVAVGFDDLVECFNIVALAVGAKLSVSVVLLVIPYQPSDPAGQSPEPSLR